MKLHEWFTWFAVLQGTIVLGLTAYVFIYYVPKDPEAFKDKARLRISMATGSYILLTLATVITAALGFYKPGDLWYWLVAVAYIIGDIAIFRIFKPKK